MPTYANNIDEDLLIFKEHGTGLAHTINATPLPPRGDIEFYGVKCQAELDASLNIVSGCPSTFATT
jgi:hypothetical protein